MIKLIEWGVPAEISNRVYNRGCIKLPDMSKPVDIMLINNQNEKAKVGEAYIYENEKGIFVSKINWFINYDYLQDLFIKYLNDSYLNDSDFRCNKDDVSICLIGYDEKEYTEPDCLEFGFLVKILLTDEPMESLIRDIRLNSIVD
jgi:hypothetical protein